MGRIALARRGDLVAGITLAAMAVWVFRDHLARRALFIGDSDRLNSFLNILTYHVDGLRSGGLASWDPLMFMGLNTFALPYIFPNPLTFLALLGSSSDLFWVAGVISCGLLVLAGWAAYALIKDTTNDPFVSWIGASLYMFSALSVLKVAQNDMSFAVLGHIPMALLALRRVRRDAIGPFVGLAFVLTSLLWFTFLQKAAYAVLLAGAYAVYRAAWGQSVRPVVVFGAALSTAVLAATPRLVTVGRELRLLERVAVGFEPGDFRGLYDFQNIRAREFLRWFDDGIFGRFPSEAAALGNNINLHEGLLLGTSVFATFLIIVGAVRHRGEWFGLLRFRNEDTPFHFAVVVLVLLAVLSRRGTYVLYGLFLQQDFTHARIVIVALLPLCVLVALVLRDWAAHGAAVVRWSWPVAVAAVAALMVLGAVEHLASRAGSPGRLLLDEPLTYHARAGIDLLVKGVVNRRPPPPRDVAASWTSSDSARVHWQDGPGETSYIVEMRIDGGRFEPVGTTGPNITAHDLRSLRPDSSHAFRVRACNGSRCSRPSAEVVADHGEARGNGRRGRIEPPPLTWLSTSRLLRIELAAITLVLFVAARRMVRRGPSVTAACLGIVMVADALGYADFQLNGPQTRHGDAFFKGQDVLRASPWEFTVPSPDALGFLHRRLEADTYRAVLVCDPVMFAAFCAPHISHFWRLPLVEGYSSGIPARLARLPWPDGAVSLRAISFASAEQLPWPLLALLNVKYAVVVDPAWYANRPHAAMPGVMENPHPPVPRAFFAASVRPVGSAAEAVDAMFAGSTNASAPGVIEQSFVEGPLANSVAPGGGRLDVQVHGDKVDVTMDPADQSRFLVLNELYHPDWRAFDDRGEVPIYPVNAVMRGVEVRPGTSHIRLKFKPFLGPATVLGFAALAVATGAVAAWGLARR